MKLNILKLAQFALFAASATTTTQVESAEPATAPVTAAVNANTGNFDEQFKAARELALSGQRDAALTAYTDLLLRSPGRSRAGVCLDGAVGARPKSIY